MQRERDDLRQKLATLGAMTVMELEARRATLQIEIDQQRERLDRDRREAAKEVDAARAELASARRAIVSTEEIALLQEAGVYKYP